MAVVLLREVLACFFYYILSDYLLGRARGDEIFKIFYNSIVKHSDLFLYNERKRGIDMYRCLHCSASFVQPNTRGARLDPQVRDSEEFWDCCPVCGSDEVVQLKPCLGCGKDGFDDFCPDCTARLFKKWIDFFDGLNPAEQSFLEDWTDGWALAHSVRRARERISI